MNASTTVANGDDVDKTLICKNAVANFSIETVSGDGQHPIHLGNYLPGQ
jgi:hypothetical protein